MDVGEGHSAFANRSLSMHPPVPSVKSMNNFSSPSSRSIRFDLSLPSYDSASYMIEISTWNALVEGRK